MITTNYDLFNYVRTIGEHLKYIGEQKLREELLSALDLSSVPGEVMGAIRYHLISIRSLKIIKEAKYNKMIDECIAAINSIL